ncbi:hypothetical protein KOR34_21320 [Posidoniimonas corsicana]|uniref:Uncharacterized protein n=1 Tax=Posidoniimonas corsicana TaxID=1938618 RepID=A0A5C5VHG8_9BACT|nr:hypothetical protein KOR34_21320 [Posidoniimonas corsicana]
MSKENCGGSARPAISDPKTVPVKPHHRSLPGDQCHGPGKPGPKSVAVKGRKRSKP